MIQRGSKTRLLIRLLAFTGVLAAVLSPAATTADMPNQKEVQKIFVTADKLVSTGKNGYAEFIGNVEAVQGDFFIRADSVKIYYRQGGEKVAATEENIEKIVAVGNVRIRSQDRQAETEHAEYTINDGTLVLIGENSTVTDGKNLIKGARIRLNRNDGQISVEGDDANRVRAIFYPSRKTARPPE